MSDLEIRAFAECRVEADDNRRIIGHAIVFNSPSVDLGGFREIIAPEAVDRSLREALDIRALVDHDSAKVLGRTRAGTLTLQKDTRGLKTIIEPDLQITYAGDLFRSVKRGDVSGMSFGFRVIEDEWNYEGQMPVRTVTDMTVREVSVVTFPAYERTNVEAALRSLSAFKAMDRGKLAWLERWHKIKTA